VSVTVERNVDGKIQQFNFEALRKSIKLKAVTSEHSTTKGKGVEVIKVKSFSSSTRDDVMHALESIHRSDSLTMSLIS
jgi:C-terminal processing protease CtpA/Prc